MSCAAQVVLRVKLTAVLLAYFNPSLGLCAGCRTNFHLIFSDCRLLVFIKHCCYSLELFLF